MAARGLAVTKPRVDGIGFEHNGRGQSNSRCVDAVRVRVQCLCCDAEYSAARDAWRAPKLIPFGQTQYSEPVFMPLGPRSILRNCEDSRSPCFGLSNGVIEVPRSTDRKLGRFLPASPAWCSPLHLIACYTSRRAQTPFLMASSDSRELVCSGRCRLIPCSL